MSNPTFLPYYVAPLFTSLECQQIIDYSEAQGFHENIYEDRTINKYCHVVKGETFDLITSVMAQNLDRLNAFGFDLFDQPFEEMYVLKYEENGWLYPHIDYRGAKVCNTRKVNTTTLLNTGYVGGELVLHNGLQGEDRPLVGASIGTTASYPGWTLHSVDRVQSGIRYSLAAWLHGPSYR